MRRPSGTKPGKLDGQGVKRLTFQSTPEEEAFLIAIEHDPTDIHARLTYADWLDVRDVFRGSYVRVATEFDAWGMLPDPRQFIPERESLWLRKNELAQMLDPSWVIRLEQNLSLPSLLSQRGGEAGLLVRDLMLKTRQVCTAWREVFISPVSCEIHPEEFVKPGKALIVVSHAEPEVAAFFTGRNRELSGTMAAALAEKGWWAEPFGDWASIVMGETTIDVNR